MFLTATEQAPLRPAPLPPICGLTAMLSPCLILHHLRPAPLLGELKQRRPRHRWLQVQRWPVLLAADAAAVTVSAAAATAVKAIAAAETAEAVAVVPCRSASRRRRSSGGRGAVRHKALSMVAHRAARARVAVVAKPVAREELGWDGGAGVARLPVVVVQQLRLGARRRRRRLLPSRRHLRVRDCARSMRRLWLLRRLRHGLKGAATDAQAAPELSRRKTTGCRRSRRRERRRHRRGPVSLVPLRRRRADHHRPHRGRRRGGRAGGGRRSSSNWRRRCCALGGGGAPSLLRRRGRRRLGSPAGALHGGGRGVEVLAVRVGVGHEGGPRR